MESKLIKNPSFNPDCPACIEQRTHDTVEWALHPLAGHGYSPESGWTGPLGVAPIPSDVYMGRAKNVLDNA